MKKILLSVALVAALASCSGTKEYDQYVEALVEAQAQIDTISSNASYGNFLTHLSTMAADFASKDVKLDTTQRDNLQTLSVQISEKLAVKYNELAATPQILPSDFPVQDASQEDMAHEPAETVRQ